MITHPYDPPVFQPTDFLIAPQRDAYLETSHYEVMVMEPQRQLKLRSRHIAAGASRLAKEFLKNQTLPSDVETVKVVEMVITSIGSGLHTAFPFSRDALMWLSSIIGNSATKAQLLQKILKFTVHAAESEVAFRHYLLYEQRAYLAIRHLEGVTAAVQIEPRVEDLAAQVSSHFLRFSTHENPPTEKDQAQLSLHLGHLLRNFAQLLKLANEQEVHFNLCRFWAEQLAARYTCSLQEWQFLISALEQSILEAAGLEATRPLSRFFLALNQAISRFTFSGDFFRDWDQVITRIEKSGPTPEFDWQNYLRMAFGELLLAPAPSDTPTPLRACTLKDEGPLRCVRPGDFQTFITQTLQACRPLAERSWVDWLETEMQAHLRILVYNEERRKSAELLNRALDVTTNNLRQGLNVFKARTTLTADLKLLLEEAQSAIVVREDVAKAKALYRSWFTLTYATDESDSLWEQGRVIVSALITGLQQASGLQSYWSKYGLALDLLEQIPTILDETQLVNHLWPHIPAITDRLASGGGRPTREPAWVMQRLLSDFLTAGPSLAAQRTQLWLIQDVLPEQTSMSLYEQQEQARQLADVIRETEPFSGTPVDKLFSEIADQNLNNILCVRLWAESERLAARCSERVFHEIPDYLEMTGQGGPAKCARDNAITLRRVALAFDPRVPDRIEFVEAWWNNLVNNYIVNRPKQLFVLNREQLVACCQEGMGRDAARLVSAVVDPVFGSNTTTQDESSKKAIKLLPLGTRHLFEEQIQIGSEPDLAMFYSSALIEAYKYAAGHSKALAAPRFKSRTVNPLTDEASSEALLEANLDYVGLILVHDFPTCEWNRAVGLTALECWRNLLQAAEARGHIFQRLLKGLIFQADLLESIICRVRVVQFLQIHLELLQQIEAAAELSRITPLLAHDLAEQIDLQQQEDLKQESYPPNRGKCERDLGLILDQFAQALSTKNKSQAILHVHRYICWHVSPNISYGEAIWRSIWQRAAQVLPRLASPETTRELATWWPLLESMGKVLPLVGLVHQKFVSSSEPVFSLDPDEESQWRNLLSTSMAILVLSQSHMEEAESLRAYLLINSPLSQLPEFEQRLNQLLKLIRNWFIDLDLKVIQNEFDALKATLRQLYALRVFAEELPKSKPRVLERLPALKPLESTLESLILRMALCTVFPCSGAGSRWDCPELLAGVSQNQAESLRALTVSDRDRFRAVLVNLFTSSGGNDQIADTWQALMRLLDEEVALEKSWTGLPQAYATASADLAVKRSLVWMSRRLLCEAWSASPNGNYIAVWYEREISPEIEHAREEWMRVAGTMPEYVNGAGVLGERTRQKAEYLLHHTIYPTN